MHFPAAHIYYRILPEEESFTPEDFLTYRYVCQLQLPWFVVLPYQYLLTGWYLEKSAYGNNSKK